MLVASPLDLQKNELRQPQIHNLASAPSAPVKGQMYYDTAVNKLFWWNGTTWIDATGGASAAPDATASVKGVLQLAGDLAGTAASPQIAAGVITDAEVAAANKNGADATPGMRSLGNTAGTALWGISTLNDLRSPTSTLSLGNQKITGLADPLNINDAATKGYVDSVAQGLNAKASVRVAYSTNQPLTGAAAAEGGVTPANLTRVLCYGQTNPAQNGIYGVYNGGAWSRAGDANTWAELISAFVWVESGSNQDTGWVCTVDPGGTLDTTAVPWTQFSGAGQITDGIGLLKTGNTLDVRLDNATIEAPSDILQVKTGGITGTHLAAGAVVLNSADVTGTLPTSKGGTGGTSAAEARSMLNVPGIYATSNQAGTTTSIPYATHGVKNDRNIMVIVRLNSTGEEVMVDTTVSSGGDVIVTFATAQTGATYSIFLVG